MPKRRRVLIVPEWYPWPDKPMRGTWVREQARVMADHADVVVLACDEVTGIAGRPWVLADATEDGVRVLRLRFRSSRVPKLAFAWRQLGMLAALRRLRATGWVPDVVHARVFSSGFPALALARSAQAPLIVSEHYTGFPRGTLSRWDRAVARFTFERAALVCPDSAELGSHIAALGTRTEVRHMPNVVDDASFPVRARRPAGAGVRLVNVASLDDKKGHGDLLAALARVRATREDVTLDVLGDGPLRPQLESRARDLGLDGAVTFHGGQPKTAVVDALVGADVFVLSSHWENEPHALIEAMAVGLPSVATAVGGVPAMVPPEAGVLVPPSDPGALAAGILDVAGRLESFDPAAIAARARGRWGRAAFAARWLATYAEVLGTESGVAAPEPAGGATGEGAVVGKVVGAGHEH